MNIETIDPHTLIDVTGGRHNRAQPTRGQRWVLGPDAPDYVAPRYAQLNKSLTDPDYQFYKANRGGD